MDNQNVTPPFIIYSLGRSRTAWLSAFLTYGDWRCYHEISSRLRSFEDIKKLLSIPKIGILETAAIPARPLIKYACPGIRELIIIRPLEEVIESYLATDTAGLVTWDTKKLRSVLSREYRELEKLSSSVLTIEYKDIATEEGCKKIFEHCLPYTFDKEWWEIGKDQNIQIDMKAFFQYYLENRDEIENFKKQLKCDLRRFRKNGEILNEVRT